MGTDERAVTTIENADEAARRVVTRRGLLATSVWAIPVVAVAAAVPAASASTDALTYVSSTYTGSNRTGTVVLTWSGGAEPVDPIITTDVPGTATSYLQNGGTITVTFVVPDGSTATSITLTIAAANGSTVVTPAIALPVAGSVDAAFAANLGTGFNQNVEALAMQADGKAVVGGRFTTANGTTSNRVARVNLNGSIDTAFSANLGTGIGAAVVYSLAVQPVSGGIVAGGDFTSPSVGVTRILASGALDSGYFKTTGFFNGTGTTSQPVRAVAALANDEVLVGGAFNRVQLTDGTTRISTNIAKYYSDGVLDQSFLATTPAFVQSLHVDGSGRILYGGQASGVLRRLNPDGTADASFSSPSLGGTGAVNTIVPAPGGGYFVAGVFGAGAATDRAYVVKITDGGTIDPSFDARPSRSGIASGVWAVAPLSDGSVLIGGQFGSPSNYLVQLNADGTSRRVIGTSGTVFVGTQRPSGAMLVGGTFITAGGVSSLRLAQLYP